MLAQQQKMILSPYMEIYELVVPKDNLLRKIKELVDLAPEEEVINPSSLTKLRKLRLKDMNLLELLINKTVSIAIEKGIIKSKNIIVDATHTKARYRQKSQRELLQEQSKNFAKQYMK